MKKLFVRHRVCSIHLFIFTLLTCLGAAATHARPLTVTESPENGDFTLFDNTATASICVEQKTDTAVLQAANGLA